MPTGAGKTTVYCEIIRLFTARGKRVLVIAHRRELIQQCYDRLAQHGVVSGIIMAGATSTPASVQVASIQTLARRTLPPADMLIIDEAHHATGPTYQRVLAAYPAALVIGGTATPYRLDGSGLSPTFKSIVAPVSVRELCNQGLLIEPTVYVPSAPSLKGVHTRGGDYAEDELAAKMMPLVGDIVTHWKRIALGKKTIAFAVNVAHSKLIVESFVSQGVRAEHFDGTDTPERRAGCLARLRCGEIDVLSNCSLVSEGWDLPALEVAILARPTKSLCLHVQQVGRIMRAGKDAAIVLDHAGNHLMHGRVTDEIEFSLDGKARRLAKNDFRTCKSCFAIIPPTGPCPQCGSETVADETKLPEHVAGELVKFTSVDKRAEYRRLILLASDREYRIGWARNQYRAAFGVWPRLMGEIEKLYRCAGHEWEEREWGRTCARCLRKYSAVRDAEAARVEARPTPVAEFHRGCSFRSPAS